MIAWATRQGPPRPTPRAPKPVKPMALKPTEVDAVQRLLFVQEFLERCDARVPWGIPLEMSSVIRAELAVLQRAADRAIERAR
jgi:hypothetical protein